MVDVVSEFSKSLRIMTGCLVNFLSGVLPSICSESDDWWRTHVFDKLSYRQQRRVEEKKINSLSGLDLQALLRILDKNWYAISEELTLSQEQLHYVKEMITVRNRWFHADASGPLIDDQYRDIDTIQRVAKIINAEQELNETVNSIKLELGYILAGPPGKIPPGETKETEEPPSLEFKVGQVVSPIASPGIRGAITSVVPGDPENRYDVFIKDSVKSFYASQLQVASESNRAPPRTYP